MNWALAVLAPSLSTALILVAGPAAVQVGYHLLCAGATAFHWKRIRPMLAWTPGSGLWSLVLSSMIASGLLAFALLWDPRALRPSFTALLFPRGFEAGKFAAAAVFTLLVHTPLEELYWRGAAMDEARGVWSAVGGGVFFFYWLHAGPLYAFMGARGLWLALPTALAGGMWALATLRTKSLWPALISHWAAEAVILAGVLRFLRP